MYTLEGSTWYVVEDDMNKYEADIRYLTLRLNNKGDIETYDFSRAGLPTLQIFMGRFVDGFYMVMVPPDSDAFNFAHRLENTGDFSDIYFETYGINLTEPNDAFWPPTPQDTISFQWNLRTIGMQKAWEITTGARSVLIGILDVGVDLDHPDLSKNLSSPLGWDFIYRDNTPDALDSAKHGTYMMGIIGAATNNQFGIAGVAGGWDTMYGAGTPHLPYNETAIMNIKAGYWCSTCNPPTDAMGSNIAARGIDTLWRWARAKVINVSWALSRTNVALRTAIKKAADSGDCVIVAAAGNSARGTSQIKYPASDTNTIAVGATNHYDSRWIGSLDSSIGSAAGNELDIVAPGFSIPTTKNRLWRGSITYVTGTSASASHVSGLAGLIRSVNPNLNWRQVRDILRSSADKIPQMGDSNFTISHGYGRINAHKAVFQAASINVAIQVNVGWNMLGVPVVEWDFSKSSVYPTSNSDAFKYQGSYIPVFNLENGVGYWLKYNTRQNVDYYGTLINQYSIPVNAGWNMIGSISSPIGIANITQSPANMVISNYFRHETGGYVISSNIEPGKGYWVKTNQAGSLTLDVNAQSSPPQSPPPEEPPLAPGAPGRPRLLAPDSGTTDRPIALTCSWYQTYSATSYRFQLSTSSTFSTLVVHDSTLTTNSKSVSSLAYNTTYYWRVKASNENGSSYWSNVWQFRTTSPPPEPPPTPVLLSPNNYSTGYGISLYLSWNPSSTATSYRLQVSRYSNFSSLLVDQTNIIETSYWVYGLSYSTTYYWRVNASNNYGTSPWSSVWQFATGGAPPPDPCQPYSSYQQMDEIVVLDSLGNQQKLYMRNKGYALGHTINGDEEMPPETPPGLFHAKFHGNKFMENIPQKKGKKVIPILVKDAVYPLMIRWNVKEENQTNYWLHIPGQGKPQEILMEGNGEVSIGVPGNGNDLIRITATAGGDPCIPGHTKAGVQQLAEETLQLPKSFYLSQNHPNPFNPTTEIFYGSPVDAQIELKVYDVLGREIKTLFDEIQSAGYKQVTFDGTNLPAGVYFYRMQARPTNGERISNFIETRKLLLIK
ncbi:MAG: S8 family serine peptidase [Bacteroidota bacterium]|nr:S8 family serine peptidase [Bacteroidota bacterium]